MLKIAILASTKATDMQAIIDAISSKKLDVEISVVVSNKKGAYALERAKNQGIDAIFIDNAGKTREGFDKEVAKTLDIYNINLIVLIGYMRYLSHWFVDKYRNRIINIHPSLLPDFAGGMDKDVHKAVLDSGVEVTGCTLHFVDEGADTGQVIMQKKVSIAKGETVDSLKRKVQKAEQEVLVEALKLFSENKIRIERRVVKIK